jgi:DNA topoisomerase-2
MAPSKSTKPKRVARDLDAAAAETLTDQQHIYRRPDAVLGSADPFEREVYIYDIKKELMVMATTDFPIASEKVYDEILVNASDNSIRTQKDGGDPGPIEIKVDYKVVSVTNYGKPFTIAKCKAPGYEHMYIPEFLLGNAKTSTNYGDIVNEGGKNGYGAKGTNVMSQWFEIDLYNAYRKKRYRQKWTNNMLNVTPPKIEDYQGEESSTTISYHLDFKRFKMKQYDDTILGLFARHAADLSFTTKNTVNFESPVGSVTFEAQKARDYAALYFGKQNVKNSILLYQWPTGVEIKTEKDGTQVPIENDRDESPSVIRPMLEVLLVDTPGSGKQVISFANGVNTKDHGIHVDAVYEVLRPILALVNDGLHRRKDDSKAKGKGKAKGKNAKEKDDAKKGPRLNITALHNHVSILVSAWVPNPSFDSQSKNKLLSFNPKASADSDSDSESKSKNKRGRKTHPDERFKLTLSEEQLGKIKNWKLVRALDAELKSKRLVQMAALTDGKKTVDIDEGSGDDANEAGGKRSQECTLFLTEGDSGKLYGDHVIGLMEGGRDLNGILPLRGKFRNMVNATPEQVKNSKEFKLINRYLGLKQERSKGVLTDYSTDEDFKTLRYGKVVLMSDADVDGKHISGLIIAMFATFYPGLLERQNFLYLWLSPVIEAKIGKSIQYFYTETEYTDWAKEHPKHTAHYTKGLGGVDDKRIEKHDFPNQRLKKLVWTKKSSGYIDLAFNRKRTNDRKDWLNGWDPVQAELNIASLPQKPLKGTKNGVLITATIPHFTDNDIREFGIATLKRNLADLDGFKDSQKSLLQGARLKFHTGALQKTYTPCKSAQFCAFTAEQTDYHHGENILYPTLVLMTQNFVGANNVPLFSGKGQFGNRHTNGKKFGQPRYTFVWPSVYFPYLFRQEDEIIYDFEISENQKTKPKRFWPILPFSLLNGTEGIAMGYSHLNLAYNPFDLYEFICDILDNKEPQNLIPWYQGFKGKIRVIDRRTKNKRKRYASEDSSDSESEDENRESEDDVPEEERVRKYESKVRRHAVKQNPKKHQLSAVIEGVVKMNKDNAEITEIPIRTSANKYKEILRNLKEEANTFKKIRNQCTDKTIKFVLEKYNVEEYGAPTTTNLKLRDQVGISNLVFVDEYGRAMCFSTVEEYFTAWIEERLKMYGVRKERYMQKLVDMIQDKRYRIMYINAVLDGKITLTKRGHNKREMVDEQAEALGIPKAILEKISGTSFTEERIAALEDEIVKHEAELAEYRQKSPQEIWISELEEFLKRLPKSYQEA